MEQSPRRVYCVYLKKEAPGLERQTYPGDLGAKIFANISQEAWLIWLKKQTMIINERKLTFFRQAHRELIEQMMVEFLFEGKDIEVEGYQPKQEQ